MLGEEPHAVGQVGVIHQAVVVELHVVLSDQLFAQAVFILADPRGCGSHPHRYSHSSGGPPSRPSWSGWRRWRRSTWRPEDRADWAARRYPGNSGGELGGGTYTFPGGRSRCPGWLWQKPIFIHDGALIPGLAHTKPIHVADAHVGHHLRRRHDEMFFTSLKGR